MAGLTQPGPPWAGLCRTTFAGHKDFVLSVATSPDGRWVVSGSRDGTVQFWNPFDGQPQFMLRGHKNSGTDFHVLAITLMSPLSNVGRCFSTYECKSLCNRRWGWQGQDMELPIESVGVVS